MLMYAREGFLGDRRNTMSRDIVDKIVQTSREIDEMRAETDVVVRAVLGLIKKTAEWKASTAFESPRCFTHGGYWELTILHHEPHARYVGAVVDDDRMVLYGNKALIVDYSSTDSWIRAVRFRHRTENAWRTLPQFVEWIAERFPDFKDVMQSYFERGKIV